MSDPKLSPRDLQLKVREALAAGGNDIVQLSDAGSKPYVYSITPSGGGLPTTFRVYAWNTTHGGGPLRASDEYRVQFTGAVPEIVDSQTTVIIGWSEKFHVFVGWDAEAHQKRQSSSPSLQVRQATIESARNRGLAASIRNSGDIVVAIDPAFLSIYFWNCKALHADASESFVEAINAIPLESPSDLVERKSIEPVATVREQVLRTVRLNYRAWDFGIRVKAAYSHSCAVCGLQLGLVEAAHLVPVAWPGSTDATSNGIALCRNHHKAYDSGLINFSDDLRVLVSDDVIARYKTSHSDGGGDALRLLQGQVLSNLPSNPKEQPDVASIALGRKARAW